MPTPHAIPAGRVIRFGLFEVDLTAGELRKKGRKVRLQDQPFQMLALLLERPGEVVTREELRHKLWPADTFVDFDHSLNTAIKKVREALGDSASNPVFVETLARRGYRFIAPIQAGPQHPEEAAAPHATPDQDSKPIVPSPAFNPDIDLPRTHRGLTRSFFGVIQGMYLVFYAAALFRLPAIDRISGEIFPPWGSPVLVAVVLITAGIGIPLRCYLLSAVCFDYQRLAQKFQRLFPPTLILDQLWALAPFLLTQRIGFGAAFAATALLLYVPFSERTLVKMAYQQRSATSF